MTKCTLKSTDPFRNSAASELPPLGDNMESLYVKVGLVLETEATDNKGSPCKKNCMCNSCTLTLQRAILRLIAALPSQLDSREATRKLNESYMLNPDVFRSRVLYLAVHKVFVMFSFPLRIRRQVFNYFFSQNAQMIVPLLQASTPKMGGDTPGTLGGTLSTLIPNSILTAQIWSA